jgi:hypothetical protein
MFYLVIMINSTYMSIRYIQIAGNRRHHRMFHICFVFPYTGIIEIAHKWKLTSQLYDKHDDFNFSIVNCPHLCSNIPISSACGILQLIQYARSCTTYNHFFIRDSLLTNKLMSKRFIIPSRLQAAFRKLYGTCSYNDLDCQ